jgi:hypothetical protein
MKQNNYKLFFIKENNKIKHLDVYDNFCEFIFMEDYSTIDIIINSYNINKKLYSQIKEMKKYIDFENMSIITVNDILKQDEIMI